MHPSTMALVKAARSPNLPVPKTKRESCEWRRAATRAERCCVQQIGEDLVPLFGLLLPMSNKLAADFIKGYLLDIWQHY